VSQFTERAEPVHRLGGYMEVCSDLRYGQQRPHPSASCLWSRLLACPDAVSRMSPRLRRNCGGSRGTLRTLIYLATYCAFERIDELACVVALLAKAPLENSSPVHPANFLQGFRRLAEAPSCVSRMSPSRPLTSGVSQRKRWRREPVRSRAPRGGSPKLLWPASLRASPRESALALRDRAASVWRPRELAEGGARVFITGGRPPELEAAVHAATWLPSPERRCWKVAHDVVSGVRIP
jgi:hypothetical protein